MSALTPAERQEMIEELTSFWHESELEFVRMTDAELANEYAGMIEVQERRPRANTGPHSAVSSR